MARFRWRQGSKTGRWCATRRQVLELAFDCGRAIRDPDTGQLRFVDDAILEEDTRDVFFR